MRSPFYFGCVEDVEDPLKIGRYRVRVVGIHTEDRGQLRVEHLPWATTLQPTTSAAISGVGQNPGLVRGSWVMVIFTDDSFQVPIIMGSIAGITGDGGEPIKLGGVDGVPDDTIRSVTTPPKSAMEVTEKEKQYLVGEDSDVLFLGTLTKTSYEILRKGVIQKESSGNYSAKNGFDFIGAYQFGVMALVDLGYVSRSAYTLAKKDRITGKNWILAEPSVWTGKDGINNREDFYANKEVQDRCFDLYCVKNWSQIVKLPDVNSDIEPVTCAKYIAICHLLGVGGFRKYLGDPTDSKDGNGITADTYANTVTSGLVGVELKEGNKTEIKKDEFGRSVGRSQGFQDPNRTYPTPEYKNQSDLHKLVRGERITTDPDSIIDFKNRVAKENGDIPVGQSNNKTWRQPPSSAAPVYPHNHVTSTARGHLFEMDDTPGHERIHMFHRSGTSSEIDSVGNKSDHISGNSYKVVEKDGHLYIKGNGHICLDGAFTLKGGSAYIELDGLHINADSVAINSTTFGIKTGTFNLQAGKIDIASGGTMNIISKVALVESTGLMSIKSNGMVAIDGSQVTLATGFAQSPVPQAPPDPAKFDGDIEYINENIDTTDDDSETPPTNDKKLDTASKAPTILDISAKPPSITAGPIYTEGEIEFDLNGDIGEIQLSLNYKVKNMLTGRNPPNISAIKKPNKGNTQEILNNLKYLCENVIEPIYKSYPSFKMTSAFRNGTDTSQHNLGQAVDIAFSGKDRKYHYEVAKNLMTLIPYDQILLEYRDSGNQVWIHISYNKSTLRKIALTLNNDGKRLGGETYSGMVLLGEAA